MEFSRYSAEDCANLNIDPFTRFVKPLPEEYRTKVEDLTDRSFGKLRVLGFAKLDRYKHPMWHCWCVCPAGSTLLVPHKYLISGKITDCGSCASKSLKSKRFVDLTGRCFDRLTVLYPVTDTRGRPTWYCQCDCGEYRVVTAADLNRGHTRSCGCYRDDQVRKIVGGILLKPYCTICNTEITSHRGSLSMCDTCYRLHNVRGYMHQKCYNPKCHDYKNYGKRGITICDDWRSDNPNADKNFISWMLANGYKANASGPFKDTLSIDRINNDESYHPSNCRVTTWKVQSKNKRHHNQYTKHKRKE